MSAITQIVLAVLTVAIVAVIVGTNSQTSTVISSAGTAFSGILGTALSPVSGSSNPATNTTPSLGF
jgi:hypothetical protein